MDRLLNMNETASRCGVSVRQIYKLVASGRFGPGLIRINRSTRVRESELQRWIEAGCPAREEFVSDVAEHRA